MRHSFCPFTPQEWLPGAKAAAIGLVVLGRTWKDMGTAGLVPFPALQAGLEHAIFLFHLPLFLFLIGFACVNLTLPWPQFFKQIGTGLVWPYVVWSFVILTLHVMAGLVWQHSFEPQLYLHMIWNPIAPLWFFFPLVAIPLFAKACEETGGTAFFMVLAGCLFALRMAGVEAGTLVNAVMDLSLYYGLGHLLASRKVLSVKAPSYTTGGAAILGFFAIMALCMVSGWAPGQPAGYLAGVGLVLCAAMAFAMLGPCLLCRIGFIRFMGANTLPIFCMHIVFTGAARWVLLDFGVHNMAAHVVLGTGLGLLGPLAIFWLLQGLGVAPWFGFHRIPSLSFISLFSPPAQIPQASS
jgi:fucose 4-O-acetylase-like acetyltransferase